MKKSLSLFLLALGPLAAGCADLEPFPEPPTNTWAGTWTVGALTGSFSLELSRSGSQLTGAIDISDNACWGKAKLAGTWLDSDMTFGALLDNGRKLEFKGTLGAEEGSGQFEDLSLCAPGGDWTVTKK